MKNTTIKKYLSFIIGTFIVAFSFNLFFLPNNLAAFGISGLSIIFNHLLGIDPPLFVIVGDVFLLVISFIFLGKEYTRNTILGSLLFPIMIKLTSFAPLVINITSANKLAIALVGASFAGIGSALIYKNGFGTGGTDVTNQIIHRYAKISMGKAIAIGDGVVVLACGFVFGIEAMVYSLITLLVMSKVCNKVMIETSYRKTCYIITCKEQEVKNFLLENIKTDITILKATGTKSKDQKILMTVINTNKYDYLKNKIKNIDKESFMVVTDAYETINQNVKIRQNKTT